MENLDPNVQLDSWQPHHRNVIIWIIILITIVVAGFILIPKVKEIKFKPIKVGQTQGIIAQKFSISPDDKWLVYFEYKYPYSDQYNFIALNLQNNKKYVIDTKDVVSVQVWMNFESDCWSEDSKYCVLPVGKSKKDQHIVDTLKYIDTPENAPWIQGNLLAVSQFAEENKSGGLPNNAPDVIVDFSNESTGPILEKQFLDSSLVLRPIEQSILYSPIRRTFDEISPNGFTCSDCEEKDYDVLQSDYRNKKYTSPNKQYVAKLKSKPNGFGGSTPPELYLNDVYIASNVYYDMYFTSDSSKLFFYMCEVGGACDEKDAFLHYIDLSGGKVKSIDLTVGDANKVVHTAEESEKALQEIQNKTQDDKQKVLKVHYDMFIQEFKNPQKIIAMNGGRFFTQNKYMFWFLDDKFTNSGDTYPVTLFLRSLVGKTVKVEMPSFEQFSTTYTDFKDYGISHGVYELWGYGSNGEQIISGEKPLTDPVYNEFMSVLRANIYLDGELINSITN